LFEEPKKELKIEENKTKQIEEKKEEKFWLEWEELDKFLAEEWEKEWLEWEKLKNFVEKKKIEISDVPF
jgi:hypothetical protein